jgi:predicted DCC family thiol-disulfide oxidoreductase YuxK
LERQVKAIFFFDGECGLCNQLVRFLAHRTTSEQIAFAPLGGITAQELGIHTNWETAVLWMDEDRLYEGEAALTALGLAGGIWILARWAAKLPGGVINPPYRWLAAHRFLLAKECNIEEIRADCHHRLLP